MFRVFANKGFQIVFSNGYEISCMFGGGNYASNRERLDLTMGLPLQDTRNGAGLESEDCEIAVYDPKGHGVDGWPNCHYGVAGWQSPDQFANLVAWVMQQPSPQAEAYSLIAVASGGCSEEHF